MHKKALGIFIATTLSLSLLAGCGNKEEEVVSEDIQVVADANTPEPTTTPTSTPKPTATPNPTPTTEPEATEEPDDVEVESDASSAPEATEEIDWSKVLWTDLIPDEYWGSSYDDNTSGGGYAYTDDNSTANTTPNQNTTPSQGTASGGGGSNAGTSGNTNNNTGGTTPSTGNTTPSTSSTPNTPAAPEQPAQHTHNYVWVESGNTRIRTCSCGETTGSAENRIADGVWGYWGDASELLTAVNNHRANGTGYTTSDELGNFTGVVDGMDPLDNSLSASAQSLAISSAQTNSYYGEGIHAGGSAQDAVSSWVGTGLLNRKTTSGGVACLAKSNGDGTYTVIWVLVVGE